MSDQWSFYLWLTMISSSIFLKRKLNQRTWSHPGLRANQWGCKQGSCLVSHNLFRSKPIKTGLLNPSKSGKKKKHVVRWCYIDALNTPRGQMGGFFLAASRGFESQGTLFFFENRSDPQPALRTCVLWQTLKQILGLSLDVHESQLIPEWSGRSSIVISCSFDYGALYLCWVYSFEHRWIWL